MAEYLQAPPRNPVLGLLSDILAYGKSGLNNATVNSFVGNPYGSLLLNEKDKKLPSVPVGDYTLFQAPEFLNNMSYGNSPLIGGSGLQARLDPRALDVLPIASMAYSAGKPIAKTLGKEVARQVETGTGLLGSNVLDPRQYATAYHGSPATFDRFDINKLGSGEGAQAYGHGMYFAENPAVAKQYTTAGLSAKAPDRATEFIIRAKEATTNDEAAKQFLQKRLTGAADDVKPYLQQALSNFDSFKGGNLYKVDIPDEYVPKMLDWDKPINEQSIEVRKSLAPYIKQYGLPMNEPGRSAHSMMLDIIGKREGLGSGSSPETFRALAPKVAEELNKAGIKGIKYLDQGSREAGGTNNFVIFDPSNVKILERNNMGLLK